MSPRAPEPKCGSHESTSLPYPRRPSPHPQFHDRVRDLGQPFSEEAHACAERYRTLSRQENEIACSGLWPPARPIRPLVGHAAFRAPLRAQHKFVLLSLVAIADADGVAMFHTGRFTAFCGIATTELFAALDYLASRTAMAVMAWASDGQRQREHVVLVRRPEGWAWSRPRPVDAGSMTQGVIRKILQLEADAIASAADTDRARSVIAAAAEAKRMRASQGDAA